MHIIKIKRKISSSQLRIAELKEFLGKHVEITVKEGASSKKEPSGKPDAGILFRFRNKEKMNLEKEAWNITVNEKHGNN